ncbi:MAG: hypothetical protein R3F19_18210 [Verrucomicrobiales bacterium]
MIAPAFTLRATLPGCPCRSAPFAGALAAALAELAAEVFVALADDVGLDVVEPEALGADGLDERLERRSSSRSRWPWVLALKSTRSMMPCRSGFSRAMARMWVVTLPPILSESFADDRPDGLLGIIRHERKVEADELVVGLGELEGLLARADLGGVRFNSSSKTSQSAW